MNEWDSETGESTHIRVRDNIWEVLRVSGKAKCHLFAAVGCIRPGSSN